MLLFNSHSRLLAHGFVVAPAPFIETNRLETLFFHACQRNLTPVRRGCRRVFAFIVAAQ